MASRTDKAKLNVITGLIHNVLILFLNFIARKVFVEFIGIEYLGVNGLFGNILSMLSLADLGFSVAMNYTFYEPLATNDRDRITGLVHFFKNVYRAVAIIVAVIGIAFLPFLNIIVNLPKDMPLVDVYYLLLLAQTIAGYLFIYKTSIIIADQNYYLINILTLLTTIIRIITQIIVSIITGNYALFLLIGAVFTIIQNVWISILADKKYPFINGNGNLTRDNKIEIWKSSSYVFVYKIASTIMGSTDNILISTLIGTVYVGFYSNYYVIINAINTIINVIYSSVTASLGNLVVTENEKKRYEIFNTLQCLSFVLGTLVFLGFYYTSGELVRLWLGSEYELDKLTVFAISFDLYLGFLMRPLWAYRDATGLYSKTKYIMLIAAGLNILFSVVFGKIIGMAGIILASSLCRIMTYVWYEPLVLFRIYFGSTPKYYFLGIIKNSFLCIPLFIMFNVVFDFFSLQNLIFDFAMRFFLVVIGTLLVFWFMYKNSKEYKKIISVFKTRLIKEK